MPLLLQSTQGDILIIIGDDNIERIKRQDPIEVQLSRVLPVGVQARSVGVVYANEADQQKIIGFMQGGDPAAAFRFATRGFEYRKDLGDNDAPPVSLLKVDA